MNPATPLKLGETRVAFIDAREPKNRTAILCEVGAAYDLSASPVDRWLDLLYLADARGTDLSERPLIRSYMRHFARFRRVPTANWMALIVQVEGTAAQTPMGLHHRLAPTAMGELIGFANEVPGFYWNNRGTIALYVTRVA